MAIHKLGDISEKKLAQLLQQPGRHADGGGLYLQVAAPGQGSWMSRLNDKRNGWKSVGPVDETSIETARELHRIRKAEYKATTAGLSLPVPALPVAIVPDNRARFAAVLESYLALNAPIWKDNNRDHNSAKYRQLLKTPLAPLWIDAITTADVETALKPFSLGIAKSQSSNIRRVLDYAAAKGLRDVKIPNPASNDILKHLIPDAPKSVPLAAMPLGDIPALMARLVADGSAPARSLAFLILTAARSSEARLADWSEINGNVWTVPGSRMKEGREHSSPLSPAALALLGERGEGLIFPGVAERAIATKLKSSGGGLATVHGFRSAFVGFGAKAGYSQELLDRAIAHGSGDANAQAYHRERLIEERRPLMLAYSDFVTGAHST